MKQANENKEKSRQSGKTPALKYLVFALYFAMLLLAMEMLVRFYWNEPPSNTLVGGNHPIYHHWPSYMPDELVGRMDMRRKKHALEKAPEIRRIVFLGDSYTFGLGVSENETIASFLQKQLDSRCGRGKFEVLNYGMVSYSPIIEEMIYRDIVSRLSPDLIILQLDPFDPQEDHLYTELATFDSNGTALAVNGIPPEHKCLERLALFRFFRFAARVIRYGGNHIRPDLRMNLRSDFFYNPQKYHNWLDFSFSILSRVNRRVKADGAEMLLITYPNPLFLKNREGYEQAIKFISNDFIQVRHETELPDMIMQRCRENGIECLNLWPDFRREEKQASPDRGNELIFNQTDGHYTVWTNKWVAGLVFDALRQKTDMIPVILPNPHLAP